MHQFNWTDWTVKEASNNMHFKGHKWDARRARDAEYKSIINRLLKLVGGSIGYRRKEANKVMIAIGLGQFSSGARLSSLHESFMSYFVQKIVESLIRVRPTIARYRSGVPSIGNCRSSTGVSLLC
ncbi:hypothetical protein BC939DRAFT_496582 [Gamsiella multidivaricata]|uniref:uncharacterized protein n=1 Tax=Gamsiella multidivaricata TaxID=101098 RepID=UPI002220A60F|nr:uncharacterized protein BC939DRAFT_496582 [Gamsiella multidivaricata]KAI7817522.1 hypothetical protein BC939DRAFT_496582 [Gamsiella multidivaricata]